MQPATHKPILEKSIASCPICKKQIDKSFRPFCSKRCADVDLSRWLNGHYAIPVVEEDGSIPRDPRNENFED
ncbi:MAG: DNA gyrase inhibitor YacG [Hyphomicrobiaceae bacterium]|nr:DNA gyrase inhibitor YacG [Hyphomicrobiaceae bacterium]